MKHTKKALKAIFGNANDGVDYLQKVIKNQPSPILFVSGNDADAFASWIASLHGSADFSSIDALMDHGASGSLTVVKDASDITDPAVQALLSIKNGGKNLVIASKEKPKILSYVRDPSFMSIYADDFSTDGKLGKELDEVKEELS